MAWSQAAIRSRISELEASAGWYQDIDLGGGIHTKTRVQFGEPRDHPRERWLAIASAVPADLSGLSVLDLGCNAGFIALEAKRRGAAHVCGVDLKQAYIDQARFCADVLGLEVEFRTLAIDDLEQLGRRFDLVFCVGVLYHCHDLQRAVERIAAVSARRLIVETQIHDRRHRTPLVRYVADSPLPGIWYPNFAALEALFRAAGFTRARRLYRKGSFLNRREGRGAVAFER